MRRQAREMALQGLYSVRLSGGDMGQIVQFLSEEADIPPAAGTVDYCQELLTKTLEHLDWANEVISAKLEHWDFNRVALLDQLILSLALVEMVFIEDVPHKVSISEAIEIAKKYSTDDSSGFINGILDALYHDLLDGKFSPDDAAVRKSPP